MGRQRGSRGSDIRGWAGAGPKIRRHAEDFVFRQSRQHVAARGGDRGGAAADDGRVQQPRHVRPACRAEQPGFDHPRSGDELELERGRQGADLPAAQGRQMARRQAVHRRRRQVHLGFADREEQSKAPRQPAQDLVSQPRKRDDERRLRGHLSPEAAAAGIAVAAGLRVVAGLSLPRLAGRHAASPDRHRSLQICRVQAQRIRQGKTQPGLLEARTALSRRHRVGHHQGSRDTQPDVHRRQVRHFLALWHDGAVAGRRQKAGAAGDLRDDCDKCLPAI